MAEKMTLEQVRDELREQAEFARGCGWPVTKTQCLKMADAIDANLTQQAQAVTRISIPTATMEYEFQSHYRRGFEAGKAAQAVDVKAIREVIAYLKIGHRFDTDMADKLIRAIGNAQAEE